MFPTALGTQQIESGRESSTVPTIIIATVITVVATRSGKQTHSEGRCRQWSAVYYTGGPKAESPLSLGPRPVFLKTLYTLSVRAKPTSPNSLKLV